jgi:hypothetical protein
MISVGTWLLQILGEIGLAERLAAIVRRLDPHMIPCRHQLSMIPWDTFAPGRLKP